MDDVGHGEARPASRTARSGLGVARARLGRAWVLWAGAAVSVAAGVAGALSFGAAPGTASVPAAVVLPASAQPVPPRVSSASGNGLEIVPAIHPVIVEPPESGATADGEGAAGDTTGGADDSGSSGSTAGTGSTTTLPTADGSGDATATSTAPTTADGTATSGTGDSTAPETASAGQPSDGAASTPTSAPSKEGDN